jgi:hypothetical protein
MIYKPEAPAKKRAQPRNDAVQCNTSAAAAAEKRV